MAELQNIATPAQAQLDVVFVHGLGGDKKATWQADDLCCQAKAELASSHRGGLLDV